MIDVRFDSLKGTQPHEYVLRFLFGGVCTAGAGLIAKHYGPVIGGLFLAFPAIFPAGASLIDKHERQRKAKAGMDGCLRGRVAASVDAAGASLGCIGLAGFAVVLWFALERWNTLLVLAVGVLAWAALACAAWMLRKSRLVHPMRARIAHQSR